MSLERKKLGDALDLFNGKKPELAEDGEFVVFGSNGTIGRSGKFNHPSSVILGRVGAYCGAVKFSSEPFWASDNTIVTRPKGDQDLKYWYYRLQTIPLRGYAGGAAQPLITHSIIKPIETDVHKEKLEQERISGVLSAFDDLIANNRRRIELLEEAALLLYREWFVRLRFPGCEHVEIVNGVPSGWSQTTIGEHCPLVYGKALKADAREPGEVDVYGSSGVVGTHNKALVHGSAIVVGRKGNVGSIYWARRKFWPIDTVYYIAPKNCDYFTYYALQHVQFINTDVAVPGLNRDFAHSRKMTIPPEHLLEGFHAQIEPIQRQIGVLERQASELAKARDLLLPRLMDGRVEV
ncbi:restriction endonuclease subunit S [Roseovarius sp. TE539]|uniref:restriction endonuclease subunit S n=1 Tax=Roseovarius sp. TE539 TaxID=2249812 RepID=UPI000DDF80A0|nr:restriction endonuclease subunit S [Roseovarius sp. TE539]RBI76145.1 restriction endonuclease subunit S [Roseovarius sp. TE539]